MAVSRKHQVPHVRDGVIVANVGIERSSSAPLLLAIIGLAAAVLYRFPPELYAFYPQCPIHEYLHLQCPGCGATRAMSALLHGDFTAALHFNAFAVLVVLPLALVYTVICWRRSVKNEPFRWPVVPLPAIIVFIVVATAFTLFRNL